MPGSDAGLTGYQVVVLRKTDGRSSLGLQLDESMSNEFGIAIGRDAAEANSLAADAGVFNSGAVNDHKPSERISSVQQCVLSLTATLCWFQGI